MGEPVGEPVGAPVGEPVGVPVGEPMGAQVLNFLDGFTSMNSGSASMVHVPPTTRALKANYAGARLSTLTLTSKENDLRVVRSTKFHLSVRPLTAEDPRLRGRTLAEL